MSRPARIALGDVALACAVAAMAMLAVFGPDGRRTDRPVVGIVLAVTASVPFLWRRAYPVAVLVVSELVFLAFLAVGSGWGVGGPAGPAMTIALYTVAANRPRRVAVAAVWLLLAANTFALTVSPTTGRDIGLALVSICGAWLVGDDVRM